MPVRYCRSIRTIIILLVNQGPPKPTFRRDRRGTPLTSRCCFRLKSLRRPDRSPSRSTASATPTTHETHTRSFAVGQPMGSQLPDMSSAASERVRISRVKLLYSHTHHASNLGSFLTIPCSRHGVGMLHAFRISFREVSLLAIDLLPEYPLRAQGIGSNRAERATRRYRSSGRHLERKVLLGTERAIPLRCSRTCGLR